MFAALLASICFTEVGPFNIQGRFADLAPEEMEWAIPGDGAQYCLTLTSAQMGSADSSWTFKKDKASGKIGGSFQYAGGKLDGKVSFENGSADLAGLRLDITGATETYNAKDKDGNPIKLTRSVATREDSPILFGDMTVSEKTPTFSISAKDLAWKPETVKIDVNFQLSGFVYSRALFPEHSHSNLAFDQKGRLLVGSGQQAAIYRVNLDQASLEVVSSTPDAKAIPAVNPVDGTVIYSFMNGHEYHLMTSGGTEKGMLNQVEGVAGMDGSPSYSAYDGKGRLYVMFGKTIAQLNGNKPAFVLSEANGFQFFEYTHFAVAKDGMIFVGSGSNVFRFAEGGKSPRKILQGPDWKPGRIHGTEAVAFDDRTNTLWVASNVEEEFIGRVDGFDRDGKFLFCLGRGASKAPDPTMPWPGQCPTPVSIAVSPEGNLYVANSDGGRSIMEFLPIRKTAPVAN